MELSGGSNKRQAPPNYFSRRVQLRLLTAVGSLMLVLVLMSEARKPENWRWMWAGVPAAEADARLETRLSDVRPANPLGTVQGVQSDAVSTVRLPDDKTEELRSTVWEAVLQDMSHLDRIELDRLLLAARRGAAADLDGENWLPALERLNVSWSLAVDRARQTAQSDTALDESERQMWFKKIAELADEWENLAFKAMRAPLDDRPWTPLERQHLSSFQELVDAFSLSLIRDDTVSRPAEQYSWFRHLEILDQTRTERLEAMSEGPATFVQVYRQPGQYRGRLVTIKGVARLVYRVSAPTNIHDIDHYYVLWIKPAGGQLSPFIVYCVELPHGFPTGDDGRHTEITEPVAITGYFFKRHAYRARDGVNTAPLLLAKLPRWFPAARPLLRSSPGPVGIALSVVGIALLAAGLARLAYRSSSPPNPAVASALDRPDLAALSQLDHGGDIGENLRRLS
jgi:hypothetical protein